MAVTATSCSQGEMYSQNSSGCHSNQFAQTVLSSCDWFATIFQGFVKFQYLNAFSSSNQSWNSTSKLLQPKFVNPVLICFDITLVTIVTNLFAPVFVPLVFVTAMKNFVSQNWNKWTMRIKFHKTLGHCSKYYVPHSWMDKHKQKHRYTMRIRWTKQQRHNGSITCIKP